MCNYEKSLLKDSNNAGTRVRSLRYSRTSEFLQGEMWDKMRNIVWNIVWILVKEILKVLWCIGKFLKVYFRKEFRKDNISEGGRVRLVRYRRTSVRVYKGDICNNMMNRVWNIVWIFKKEVVVWWCIAEFLMVYFMNEFITGHHRRGSRSISSLYTNVCISIRGNCAWMRNMVWNILWTWEWVYWRTSLKVVRPLRSNLCAIRCSLHVVIHGWG